jgi:TRAP-type C4-dicarboxylate transport system permease small subunit
MDTSTARWRPLTWKEEKTYEMKAINTWIIRITKGMSVAAGVVLVGMMAFVVIYIIARLVGHAIYGTYEIVQLCSLSLVCLVMSYNEYCDGNITIDTFYVKRGDLGKRIFNIFANLLVAVICSLTAYREIIYTIERYVSEAVTPNLKFPIWIFVIILAVTFCILALVSIFKLISYIIGYKMMKEDASDVAKM